MVSLIKAGAFDSMMERKACMEWYLWETCDKKQRLTLQNVPSLMKYNLIPDSLALVRRVYEFNRYLKAITKQDKCAYKEFYSLNERAISFLQELGLDNLMTSDNLTWFMDYKAWDKVYQKYMNVLRDWLSKNKESVLKSLNEAIFKEEWDKYAQGTISAWEMDVMCFYYHEHELAHLDTTQYGLSDFFKLPEEPIVDKLFARGDKQIKTFKLTKIAGTAIAKDKNKSILYLLTTTGVVTVKLAKELFASYDRQISEKFPDGTKSVLEKSWLSKGNKLIITGYRRGEQFVAKTYRSTGGKHIYHINEVFPNGEIVIQTKRAYDD